MCDLARWTLAKREKTKIVFKCEQRDARAPPPPPLTLSDILSLSSKLQYRMLIDVACFRAHANTTLQHEVTPLVAPLKVDMITFDSPMRTLFFSQVKHFVNRLGCR